MFGEKRRDVRASTSTVPKRSQPKPNGSDASEKTYWPVMTSAREVVRDGVDERDRHEAAARTRARAAARSPTIDSAIRVGAEIRDRDERGCSRAGPRAPSAGREQLGRPRRVEDVRPLEVGAQVLPERRAAEPVEPDRAEHDGDEGEHARRPLGAGEPRERHPDDEPALVLAERRDPGEQAEVDGEAVAVLVPRPPAEGGHPEPHHVAVERDRERERARARRLGVGELERREAGEEDRAGPDAEPLAGRRAAASTPGPSRRQSHATPSAIASHGLSTRQTLPSSTCSGTSPSQKTT